MLSYAITIPKLLLFVVDINLQCPAFSVSPVPQLCFALEQTELLGFFRACSSTLIWVSAFSCWNFLPPLPHTGNFINGSEDKTLTSTMTARPRPCCPVNKCTLLSIAQEYKKLKMCRLFHMQDFSAFCVSGAVRKKRESIYFVFLNAAGSAKSFS